MNQFIKLNYSQKSRELDYKTITLSDGPWVLVSIDNHILMKLFYNF